MLVKHIQRTGVALLEWAYAKPPILLCIFYALEILYGDAKLTRATLFRPSLKDLTYVCLQSLHAINVTVNTYCFL